MSCGIRWCDGWRICAFSLLLLAGCQQDSSTVKKSSAEGSARPASEVVETSGQPEQPTEPVRLTQQELADGWISLFDGQTLFGWKHENKADWRVEQGAIVVQEGEKGLLITTTQFTDYILKLRFRCEPDTNSGIFLATQMDPGDVSTDCYELNVAGMDNPFPTGSLVNRQAVTEDLNRSDWQSYEVRVERGHIVVLLDGQQVLDYTDPMPLRRGHIGLQLNQGKIEFGDIKLKPLGLQSMFDGKTLDGWKTYPEMPSKFTVDPAQGVLNVEDGRGQLETQQSYGDFVMQLECITHAPGLNSGVFFRCIPGEQMNGYECQIHNGFKDEDRGQPVDCGTGGIFRRQDARQVVADDLKWFAMTLIADGPHMAAWVNGFQVSDWIDTRRLIRIPARVFGWSPGPSCSRATTPPRICRCETCGSWR